MVFEVYIRIADRGVVKRVNRISTSWFKIPKDRVFLSKSCLVQARKMQHAKPRKSWTGLAMGQIDSFLTGLGKKGQGRPCRKNEFLGEDEREMEKLKSL